jgi:lipoate-protein ligase A
VTPMVRLDLTLQTLAENLALDEALLLEAEAGGPAVLRFWEWPHFAVVVGAGGRLSDEVRLERCAADGVPVMRRSSGGGTVLIGPGCLLYSLIVPMDLDAALRDLNASYRFIMNRMATALTQSISDIAWAGTSDLVWGDRKFSGNAQQRKRNHLLHHGTLLYAFELPMIDAYVRQPPRMPDYRRARPHGDFVANVPMDAERLKMILSRAWNVAGEAMTWPREGAARLAQDKYARDDWVTRR